MASNSEEEKLAGRRTRSGRKVSGSQPTTSPARATRRTVKKQAQLEDHEKSEVIHEDVETDFVENNSASQQSDIIKEMLAEAAQGAILDEDAGGNGELTEVIEIADNECTEVDDIIDEVDKEDEDDCIIYEEEHLDAQQAEDVEMYTIQEEELVNNEAPANTTAVIDDKSSSFPFGNVVQSETSEDIQNEEEEIEEENNDETTGIVESSLLASLAGDNANSLPSVGGGEETELKKDDFEEKAVEPNDRNIEKMDSDDSMSEPAIAEDIAGDVADATMVNIEMVSEDELPMPTKPEINDAEEVSDEELPAPQRAELPADAEVISEDELPTTTAAEKKTPSSSPRLEPADAARQKRKAEETDKDQESHSDKQQKVDVVKDAINEQYNPMSPTSESNDSPPVEKKAKIEEEETVSEHKERKKETKEKDKDKEKEREREKEKEKEKERKKLPDLEKYWRSVKEDPADFTGWTYLLQYVDNESDAEAAREAYDAFLSHYPYCYGYWRKYADYEKRKGIKANCNTVFERGLEAIPLSVDLWIHYLAHVKSLNGDDEEYIRAQFERAINACGLEFRSDKLWDAYVKWENDSKRYQRITQIYDRLLAIPTQGYSGHFDNFQDLINQHSIASTISNEELAKIRKDLRESSSSSRSSRSSKERRAESKEKDKEHRESKSNEKDIKEEKEDALSDSPKKLDHANETSDEAEPSADITPAKNEKVVKEERNLSDPSTLTDNELSAVKDKIISLRRKLHKTTVAAVTARWTFEEGIKRPYFHVKPLERCQLKNWKDYLDYEIEKGDRKRILVLFERCLIACALYDEFWLKMIRYLETLLDQPNIPEITSDVYRRACEIHHPDKPSLHLMWSAFEECQHNFDRAAEVLVNLEKTCPNLLQVAYRRINVERRRGDMNKCKELYEHYISTAKNKTIAGSLAIKYARFLNKICADIDGGLRVLQQTLEKDAGNTRVALQMVDLTLQRPKVDEDEVISIMDKFMSRENIDPEQKVLFAQRKVEFLEDFGRSATCLQEAQRGLQLALSKANEAKKKRESSPSRKSSSTAMMKEASSAQSAAYNNGAATTNANYNYNSANSAYYGQQNSSAYQQSYDGYYNQWQYGSAGYGGYSQWSGYGNYY